MKKRYFLFLVLGLLIMAIMLYFIGIDEVLSALALSNLWLVLLAIIVQVFTYYLYTLRWYLINKTANIDLGVKKLLPMVMVGLAVNNMTPSGRGGGEPVRAYLLSKNREYHFQDTFATVVADRTLDTFPFILLAIFTIFGIIFNFSLDIVWIAILILCVIAILAIVVIIVYMSINEAFGERLIGWIIKLVRKFYKNNSESLENQIVDIVHGFQNTMNDLIRDKTVLYYALPLSFVIWGFEILRVYLVFLAFGANISPIVIGEVFIIASLVGMVPLLPGGLGAVDGIMIVFYSSAGITASISAAATVIERLISFWMATIIGFLFLPMYGASIFDESLDKLNETQNELSESEDENKLPEPLDDDQTESADLDSCSQEDDSDYSDNEILAESEEDSH